MSSFFAIARYELLLQWRTGRFRLAAALYVAICAVPPVLVLLFFRHQSQEHLGAATYLAQTLFVQPYLTTILAVLVAGNRSSRQALTDAWPVLAATPMSNSGYLFRRWLAMLVIIVPLSAIPQLGALGTALAAGHGDFDASVWLGTWLARILPLGVWISAYWLGMTMILGGELGALVVSFLGMEIAMGLINQALLRLHLTLDGLSDWLGAQSLSLWIYVTSQTFRDGRRNPAFDIGYAATEAPYDLAHAADFLLPRAPLGFGLAACALCLAVASLRRTRRDLPPRPVRPDHQLRTILEMLNRQRERYAADGGLALRDRAVMICGVLALATGLGLVLARQHHFQALAAERYQAEMHDDYEPMPRDVRATNWSLRGRLERDGSVATELAGRLENRGTEPREHLAFAINPGLTVEHLAAPPHRVEMQRSWDRLQVRIDPPLASGESLNLEVRLAGVPETIRFFPRRGDYPFVMRYERLRRTRLLIDMNDLGRAFVLRGVSERRIALEASDLFPVPRYTPWTLIKPNSQDAYGSEMFGRFVPEETFKPEVDLELDLSATSRWFLADTCGHVGRAAEGRTRLVGACRAPLAEFQIRGGPLTALDGDSVPQTAGGNVPPEAGGHVVFAALPAHREEAKSQLEALALVSSLSDRAWPGMKALDDVVALEWPPPPDIELHSGMFRWSEQKIELFGQMLIIPERLMVDRRPLKPEDLVAQLLSRDLLARRPVQEDQKKLFRSLYAALMLRRMGLVERGATVSGPPWMQVGLKTPILVAQPGFGMVWKHRLPAVMVEIESRLGSGNLYAGIESFLAKTGGEPGTIKELFAELESRSGVSLERLYEDHFEGNALPMLRLADVSSRREDDRWVVHGTLRNTGTGESICPVIVKTELTEHVLRLSVDSESDTPFSLSVANRPHTVVLDPEGTCYRFVTKVRETLERVNVLS